MTRRAWFEMIHDRIRVKTRITTETR